jgi:hypothetical protein
MSGLIVGLVLRTPVNKKFNGECKFVAMVYAEHAWEDGTHAYPAISTVANLIGCSSRSVQRHVRTLEQMGMLVPDGKGPRGTIKYKFPLFENADGSVKLNLVPTKIEQSDNEKASQEPETPEENLLLGEENKGGDNLSGVTNCQGDTDSGDKTLGDTGVTQINNPSLTTTTKGAGSEKFLLGSYPQNMLEANQHPAIQLYRAVSGVFPGQPYYVPICDALQLISSLKSISDIQSMKDYLQPFWLAWSTRCGTNGQQYNQLNPAWLTEWAVGGQIPPAKGDKHAPTQPARNPKSKADQPAAPNYSDADRRAAERIKARRKQVQV